MSIKHTSLTIALSALLFSSCAAMKERKEEREKQARTTREERPPVGVTKDQRAVTTYYSLTVDYKDNSSRLDEDSQKRVSSLVHYVRNHHDLKNVEIAAWSDKPFPAEPNSEFIRQDQKLAEMRADSLKNYLNEELDVSWFDIQTYNMAEEPGVIARMFNTDSAELKSIFARRGAEGDLNAENLRIIRDRGAPGKSVLVIKAEPKDN